MKLILIKSSQQFNYLVFNGIIFKHNNLHTIVKKHVFELLLWD